LITNAIQENSNGLNATSKKFLLVEDPEEEAAAEENNNFYRKKNILPLFSLFSLIFINFCYKQQIIILMILIKNKFNESLCSKTK